VDKRNIPSTRTGLSREPTDGESEVRYSCGEPGNIRLQWESCKPGEDRYEGTLVFPSQVLSLELNNRVETLLNSLSVLDQWLEKNDGQLKDEVRVQRIKHWKGEVLQQLNLPRV